MTRAPISFRRALGILMALGMFAAGFAPAASATQSGDAQWPEIAYLKRINEWRPPSDPQLLFLLMQRFANAGRHEEGIEFIESLRKRFDPRLDDGQRAFYLTAIASLRAGHAQEIPLLRRIGWMRDTVAMLDEAQRLSGGDVYIVHWMSGIVRARLPGIFGERDAALRELEWCEANAAKAPTPGWLREVDQQLAAVHRARGENGAARHYQARSGLPAEALPVIFTTPYSEDSTTGHVFSPRAVREVVPGTVYQVSGYDFMEFYFVVSADRRELIAIDAGATSQGARAAFEALAAKVSPLPPLTAVLVTHAHWDHVGGQRYFRGFDHPPKFYGRANFAEELSIDALGDPGQLARFFGRNARLDDVLSYRPDVAIDHPTELTLGGTRFELLPTRGGETTDAMLIRMPGPGVLFVGDIVMPYFGAPFSPEGSVDGMLASIDQIDRLHPKLLLHGHEALNRIFSSDAVLNGLRDPISWTRDEVLKAMKSGSERGAIQAANLTPPSLERADSAVHLAFLVLRENLIDRVFSQNSGYWQNGLQGLDALTDADRGDALVRYLGLSESQIAAAAGRMVADGRHELAAAVLRWAGSHYPDGARLGEVRRLAYLKLMEKYQDFNPFKFVQYSAQIGQAVPQIPVGN